MVWSEQDVRARGAPLTVGYGGGVNSLAVLIGLRDRNIVPDLILFADTGDEKPETYDHMLEAVAPWLVRVGFPGLTVVKKASPIMHDNSLEDACLRKSTLPSRAFGMSSCAMKWKIGPQEKFLNGWPPAREAWARGERPFKVLGYDADEGERRAKIHDDKKIRYWYPLIEWGLGRDECVASIEREGLSVPPKSACFYCPSSTKSEVLALAREHPELMERALAMERKAIDSGDLVVVKGLGRHWSWASLLASDDKTLFPEAPVEACTICHDGEAT